MQLKDTAKDCFQTESIIIKMSATEIENTFEQQKIPLKYSNDARIYFQI